MAAGENVPVGTSSGVVVPAGFSVSYLQTVVQWSDMPCFSARIVNHTRGYYDTLAYLFANNGALLLETSCMRTPALIETTETDIWLVKCKAKSQHHLAKG